MWCMSTHLDPAVASLLGVGLGDDEVEAHHGQDGAVAQVSVHDAEEEGERARREQRGVGLAIARHTVRVDELLEGPGELVRLEVRGRRRPRLGHLCPHQYTQRGSGPGHQKLTEQVQVEPFGNRTFSTRQGMVLSKREWQSLMVARAVRRAEETIQPSPRSMPLTSDLKRLSVW